MGRSAMILAVGMALAASSAPALAQSSCSRESLDAIADKYVAAQTEGMALRVPMGNWVQYRENFELSSMTYGGILATPQKIDWHRSFVDTDSCTVYVEAIITDPAHPYVLATKLSTRGGSVNAFDVIVTDEGDWLFDAQRTLAYARQEDWGEIPEGERDSRQVLQAAADAYLDSFKDESVEVPWGTPCARLEGGLYTGKGRPDDSCNVGVPEGVDLTNRSYVIDPAVGAVAVFLRFGGPEGLPDAHVFRVEKGRIRYVHTITNCGDMPNCGFPPLSEMLKNNPALQPDLQK
ncbi:conserved hypothetical protein [Altererythrobacter sp. B11]|uniref:hypothetical protein n=1 Tax=Altererythrobacter sp. B11 TaxID=2060312 RepID=UPI000DC7430D|nr:hypothetical protein [Altererythrobacter sp. B11]BBC73125.1 conserved hypothetical protein [Altererythrobacter sp. B11]